MSNKRRLVDITQRIIYLRSIPVAASLSPAVLHVIAGHLRERFFPAGNAVVREGEAFESLHLFTEGGVCLSSQGKTVGQLKPPQSIGFLGILARGDSPYDAIAETDSRSLELRADALLEVMEDHFELFFAATRYVAERLLQEMKELPAAALNLPFEEEPMPAGEELDLIGRIFFLRKMSAFSKANVNALATIANQSVERRFAPGEPIWRAGEPSNHALMIVSGTLACSAGERRFRLGPGSIAGGVESLAGQPHWYDVAAGYSKVLAMESRNDDLLDVFEENYPMAMDFLAGISGYLQHLISQRTAHGLTGLAVPREVSALGVVPVGA